MDLKSLKDDMLLAVCVWAEARGETLEGQTAVAWVVRNRVADPCWWGHDYHSVILCPSQFSWTLRSDKQNARILRMPAEAIPPIFLHIAMQVIAGEVPDPTNGCTSYFAKHMNPWPKWESKLTFVVEIGNHRFYK